MDFRNGIPPVPSTALRCAVALAGDELAGNDELIDWIEASGRLKLEFLTGANLPMFCEGRPIRTVRQGIGELGRRKTQSLFWLMALSDFLQSGTKRADETRNRLWRHSLLTGVLAQQLVKTARLDVEGDALTAGLAHDVGQLMLSGSQPRLGIVGDDAFDHSKDIQPVEDLTLLAAEHVHCRLGASLLEFWSAPASLISCALCHHDPENAGIEQRTLVIGVRLADIVTVHLELDLANPPLRLNAVPAWHKIAIMPPWNRIADLDRLVLEQVPEALVTAEHMARVLGA